MGLLRSLMKKRSIALMNDQKYNAGLAVPLFGYECMTADGPTRLALKFKVPLIPITGRRIEGTRVRGDRLRAHPARLRPPRRRRHGATTASSA